VSADDAVPTKVGTNVAMSLTLSQRRLDVLQHQRASIGPATLRCKTYPGRWARNLLVPVRPRLLLQMR
jgi:hypothetical protein